MIADPAYSENRYSLRWKLNLASSGGLSIFGADGSSLRFYADFTEKKMVNLKHDFTVFTDESRGRALMRIVKRHMFDVGATYDITDPGSGQKIGTAHRRRLTFFSDRWDLLDAGDQAVGGVAECGTFYSICRRMFHLHGIVPQSYELKSGDGTVLARFKQGFTGLTYKLDAEFLGAAASRIPDKRLGIALAVSLMAGDMNYR